MIPPNHKGRKKGTRSDLTSTHTDAAASTSTSTPSQPSSTADLVPFAERHPRAAAAIRDLGAGLHHAQAEALRRRHELEDRIRADERARIAAQTHAEQELIAQRQREEEKAAKERREAEAQLDIIAGCAMKIAGQYDAALPFFYAALGILHSNKKYTANDEFFRLLFGITFDFRDNKIVEVYLHIADCYQGKGDYVTAIKCYKKLVRFGIAGMAASNGIQACDAKIQTLLDELLAAAKLEHAAKNHAAAQRSLEQALDLAIKSEKQNVKDEISGIKRQFLTDQIRSLLDDAAIAHKANEEAAAQAKLQEAARLARDAHLHELLTQIATIGLQFRWDSAKPEFMSAYSEFETINLFEIGIDYPKVIAKLYQFLQLYAEYSQVFSSDERSKYQRATEMHKQAQDLLREQQELNSWRDKRSNLNRKITRLAELARPYPETDLPKIAGSFADCCSLYTRYQKYLNDEDKAQKRLADELHAEAMKQLRAYEAKLLREWQRQQNIALESELKQGMQDLHQALVAGNIALAIEIITGLKRKADQISHAEDLQDKSFAHKDFFKESIFILNRHFVEYQRNQQQLPPRYARRIISAALRSYPDGWNKILLERHQERLETNISTALRENWIKFHGKSKSEYGLQNGNNLVDEFATLFERLTSEIHACLTTTSWGQRWWPGNWTEAALCLKAATSKTIAPALSEIIADYVPATPPVYIQLPILPAYSPPMRSATFGIADIPVAVEVPTVGVAVVQHQVLGNDPLTTKYWM